MIFAMMHKHPGSVVTVLGNIRCSGCGHRMTVGGIPPLATRNMPKWQWPLEILGRFLARRCYGGNG